MGRRALKAHGLLVAALSVTITCSLGLTTALADDLGPQAEEPSDQFAGSQTYYLDAPSVTVTGDVAFASRPCDPEVAGWARGNGTHGTIIGVDPCSPDPADWGGATVTLVARSPVAAGKSVRVTVGLVAQALVCGKGIHSPVYGSTAALTINGLRTPFVCRDRSCNSLNYDYYAVEAQNTVVKATAGMNGQVRIVFRVPARTAWDVSYVRVTW